MSGPLARPRRPKGRGQRPAVMTDVAKLAGVSHQTVSRVLHDSPHVKRGTRERVLAAIRQLDYRPNTVAQALVTGRSRSLGVVSFDTTLYGPASTLLGVEEAAHDRGYAVSIASLRSLNRASVVGAVQRLRDQGVDGVVVIAPQRAAVDALLHLPPEIPVVAVAAGVGEPPLYRGDWSARSGYDLGEHLLGERSMTAVFVANDQMALGLLRRLHEAGRATPGEVSVVGFDDIPEAAYFTPPLTTVRQDFAEVGRSCLHLLLGQIDSRVRSWTRVVVAPELVVRGSTTAARGR